MKVFRRNWMIKKGEREKETKLSRKIPKVFFRKPNLRFLWRDKNFVSKFREMFSKAWGVSSVKLWVSEIARIFILLYQIWFILDPNVRVIFQFRRDLEKCFPNLSKNAFQNFSKLFLKCFGICIFT